MDRLKKPNEKLAEEVGTTQKIVSRWERGISKPQPHYRQGLCKLFGKNAEELGLTIRDMSNRAAASPHEESDEITNTPPHNSIQDAEDGVPNRNQDIQILIPHSLAHSSS